MKVEKFKLKARKCIFSEEEMAEMLETYSTEWIITYFKNIIQAMGIFSNYRKYIDTGIIRKYLFEVLLQQYTKKERKYTQEKNVFIVPELLLEGKDSRLRMFLTFEFMLKTDDRIAKEKFWK
eukprot:snap_masked-scaffold_106-processed-gene-0.1-mRNA-1 protein AED:1.00 eAED:1.00 QI:0/0/0/0/1/1/4/0/121